MLFGGRLFLEDVADVFDGFANLAFRAAHGRLSLAGDFVDDALVVQVRIPRDGERHAIRAQ